MTSPRRQPTSTSANGRPTTNPRGDILEEPLLDANEAAQLLHVPRNTLYELVRSRGLPHVRIGNRGMRFTRAGLEEWVEQNTFGTRRSR